MLVLFVAFLGQSWNISGGFAGQTSFGRVVFFGTGAYLDHPAGDLGLERVARPGPMAALAGRRWAG